MTHAFFCACTARGAWRVSIERGQCAHVERQEIGLLGGCRLGACCVHRVCARRTLYFSEGWASLGEGFGRRTVFSPGPQAREGREDPRTEPHVPAHAAPENPTPITLEDMSDQEGVGSVSKAEATLTHPSARGAETTPPQQAGAPARISRQGGGLFR